VAMAEVKTVMPAAAAAHGRHSQGDYHGSIPGQVADRDEEADRS